MRSILNKLCAVRCSSAVESLRLLGLLPRAQAAPAPAKLSISPSIFESIGVLTDCELPRHLSPSLPDR